jgi:hypothetical protein
MYYEFITQPQYTLLADLKLLLNVKILCVEFENNGTHHPDDGGSKLLLNVDQFLSDYTV